MNGPGYYELYRKTTIGMSLIESLDNLILDQRIEPQLALRVLANFDRIIAENIKEKLKAKLSFKGHLHIYRFCDDVWTFVIKNVDIKLDHNEVAHADRIEIVANNSKRIGET
ncbi:transcription initiation factor IIA subunit gamma [Saccharomycopsis crataegensis]|uniref:Transcription initiation factor IIA subunit 2 n=1 Tax=Saccharomycopsis crataegensis TaxID=43959 RepID=A0AAV5QKP6_9ASCO|nr:transcription initiation factor IIA subunit gamma [Saccharomycopsis crataegensis]